MRSAWIVETPIGLLTLVEEDGALVQVRFGKNLKDEPLIQTSLLAQAARELEEYFRGERKIFGVKLAPKGTPFQQKCWQVLADIPYGQTRTYRQQAEMVGNANACRAVGMSNHRNPIPVFIPCHRVVGANGKLAGYAGGLEIKEKLLILERMHRL